MIDTKIYTNTVLLSFRGEKSIDRKASQSMRSEILNRLKNPFTNLFVDFKGVSQADYEALDALMAAQRLSEINSSQLSLFNVGDGLLAVLKKYNLDKYFYFCDRPKPFSEELLMV